MIDWYIGPIDNYINSIYKLFLKNKNHKHEINYILRPWFEFTKFARIGFDNDNVVYYSAGIEKPEYNNSIRIMSRHTRDRSYDFGSISDDLNRGTETLDSLTAYALNLGYKDIWVSREESPDLIKHLGDRSKYQWSISLETLPSNTTQYVLRLK